MMTRASVSMTVVREVLLGLVLLLSLGLVVYGLSLWSLPIAFVVAGLGIAGIGFFFLTEAG